MRQGQDKVVQYREGRMAVPAVPGSGKTTCLAYLAAELLAENPRNRILIVTVMNSAVANFRFKISRFLTERGLPARGYQVKTLHSLAAMVIKEKPGYLLINEAFQILDEQQQETALGSIIDRWLDDNRERWIAFIDEEIMNNDHLKQRAEASWHDRIKKLLPDIIKIVKLRGLAADQLNHVRSGLGRQKDSFLRWAIEVMDRYDDRKRREGAVDFDDLIACAYHLLRDDEGVRNRLQERWSYIFEDESQDSNPLQEKMLNLLSSGRGNLVRVGDTNQGIMRFSGTDPELFRRFCAENPSQPICVASRSTADIMDFANHFVDWVRHDYPYDQCRNALEDRKIVGVDPSDPYPNPTVAGYGISTFCSEGNDVDEALLAARKAADFARENPDKTVAVLTKYNNHLNKIAEMLRGMGVEYDFVGGSQDALGVFHHVAELWAVLRYLAGPFDRQELYKVLCILVSGLADNDSASEFISGIEPEALLYPLGGEIVWTSFAEKLSAALLPKLQQAVVKVRNWLEMSYLEPDELVLQLAAEVGLKGDELDLANSLCSQLTILLRQHPGYGLADIVRELDPTLDKTLQYMAGVLQNSKGYEPRPGVISLATQYKAKGLEWDTVFVSGLASDLFLEFPYQKYRGEVWCLPDRYKNPLAMAHSQLMYLVKEGYPRDIRLWGCINQICEDLRLLYVSFTRAKRCLSIGTHKNDHWGKTLKQPSRIFREIDRYIEEKRNAG